VGRRAGRGALITLSAQAGPVVLVTSKRLGSQLDRVSKNALTCTNGNGYLGRLATVAIGLPKASEWRELGF
jgi:hypothetical protein